MIKDLNTSKSVEKLVLEAVVSFAKHQTRIWKGRVHKVPKTRKTIKFDSMSPSNKLRGRKAKRGDILLSIFVPSTTKGQGASRVKKRRVEKGRRFMFPLDCDLMMIDNEE